MNTKGDFVLEWDKALGYKGDPFADKIFTPITDFLVNRNDEKEKLNWFFIKNYFYGSIIGEHGVGKTTMLRWLENRLKKYNRIHSVYLNAAVFREQINIPHQMLSSLLSFYEKNLSKPHTKLSSSDFMGFLKKKLGNKSVALLIDNAHNLTDKNIELLKSLREEGLRFQIVVTSSPHDYEKSRLPELEHDELKITLGRPNFEESVEMVKKRIENFGGKGITPFTVGILRELYDKADKNPRQFLHLCRDEAIKILLHKKEAEEGRIVGHSVPAPQREPLRESKNIKTAPRKALVDDEMELKIRRAAREELEEEERKPKKGFFRIRFDMSGGKKPAAQHSQGQQTLHPMTRESREMRGETRESREMRNDKKAIYDERLKQTLVNQLNSTSPRRKPMQAAPSTGKHEHKIDKLSETERILRELSDQFEK